MKKEKIFLNEPLRADEKETHLNLLSSDRSTWTVYTDDEKMIALFDRIASNKTEKGFGYEYLLDSSKISFTKPIVAKPEKGAKVIKEKRGSSKIPKQSFGSYFISLNSWNASPDSRELVSRIDFNVDPVDFSSIKNLKQLRALISKTGDKSFDQKVHKLTLEIYRKFVEK